MSKTNTYKRLEGEHVLKYLSKRKLIDMTEVVSSQYAVKPLSTRNNVLKIESGPGKSLFIKQLGNDDVSSSLFHRETGVHRFFHENQKAFFGASVPSLVHVDEEQNMMITEWVDGTSNLHDYYMSGQHFDPELAHSQAAVLAAYHAPASELESIALPQLLPWVLQLDKHEAHQFFPDSPNSATVIGIVKEDRLLSERLLHLAKHWKQTHLIHGDMKWVNLLVKPGDKPSHYLVDWELADLGDPVWDVAGLLQSYLSTWLFGFDNSNPHSITRTELMKPYDLSKMQPSAIAFLEEYLRLRSIEGQERSTFLLKVIEYTAARIIQTCIEGVKYSQRIEPNNIRGIQLAHNMMADPDEALFTLLSIKR